MKTLSSIVLFLGIALLSLAAASSGHAFQGGGNEPGGAILTGECDPLVPNIASFDCGADSCAGWFGRCKDGPKNQDIGHSGSGKCEGTEGECQEQNVTVYTKGRVDCACQDDGRTCGFNKIVGTGGATTKKNCFNFN